MKVEANNLNMKRIKNIFHDIENRLQYALVGVVILIGIVIELSGLFRCN
jgi:hypothetical protein